MNDQENVSDIMESGRGRATSAIVGVGGILVYLAAIIYAETHGISMLIRGVSADFLVWAVVGMIALGVTAVLVPLGLHNVYTDPTQRMFAFLFYGIDIFLMAANAAADFALNTSAAMPWWLTMYIGYVVPMTPVFAGLGWSIISFLDPEAQERVARSRLQAAARRAVIVKVAQAARSDAVNALVKEAAEEMTRRDIESALGLKMPAHSAELPARIAEMPAQMPAQENPDKTLLSLLERGNLPNHFSVQVERPNPTNGRKYIPPPPNL